MTTLIQQIEKFLAEQGISERQFGELAMNDSHFLRQLRTGRDIRMSTVEKVQQFMLSYAAEAEAAADAPKAAA